MMSAAHNGRGAHPPGSQSYRFFEKAAPALQTIRRSTPDSEALASSDDDHDHPLSKSTHSLQTSAGIGMPKPARRASWLSEVQSGSQRKFSIGSASSLQHSQPSTPAAETGSMNWGAPVTRPPASSGSYPWAGGWTMAPSGVMSEALTTGMSTSAIDDVQPLMSPTSDEHDFADDPAAYPFNIGYTPVRKNVRSQSYSAGQQQPPEERGGTARATNRMAHRPSRPSMLGEGGNGRPALGLVMEDEDDEYAADPAIYAPGPAPRAGAGAGRQDSMLSYAGSNSSLLKQAAVENALLKQRNPQSLAGTLPAEVHQAYLAQMAQLGLHSPRGPSWIEGDDNVSASQYGNEPPASDQARSGRYPHQPTWSSNLGFGEIIRPSESRRASFADTRSGITGVPRTRTMSSSLHSEDNGSVLGQDMGHAPSADDPYQQPQQALNPYAVPQTFSTPTPDLFIVAFKCARAGTFYVPANTGLQVKVGDNVIVEGDRGIDLGTVTHAQVTLAEAKQLTQAAKDAHFKWLMMFSKTKQVPSAGSVGMMNAGPDEPQTAGANRSQQSNSKAEDRPKMIRSIATHHQIQQLREKEGAEAKAKRVAQVKVGEHQLDMEILDAEMQYDWKKLTFFFYSPKYVNFNNLVIDLFKIYKTRIWMDAITNGTSQAAQDDVLGAAGPVVASSSPSMLSPAAMRELSSIGATKKPPTRSSRPETELYADTSALTGQYPAGATTSPLQLQSSFGPSPAVLQGPYSQFSHASQGYAGSPPSSASAYSPYDQSSVQSQYGGYATSPRQQQLHNSEHWTWKHMHSPTTNASQSWNDFQSPHNMQQQSLLAGQSSIAGAQRGPSSSAADAEQLTAYLRNLALNTPR